MRRGYSAIDFLIVPVLCGMIVLGGVTVFAMVQREQPSRRAAGESALARLTEVVGTTRLTEGAVTTEFSRRGVLLPSQQVRVHAEATGRAVARHVSVGDKVQQDDAILELDGKLVKIRLDEARARQQSAQIQLADAERQLADAEDSDTTPKEKNGAGKSETGKSRADKAVNGGSDKSSEKKQQTDEDDLKRDLALRRDAARAALDLANAQCAEAEQAYEARVVRSPVHGIVSQILVDTGEYAASGHPVAQVIVTDPMKVVVAVTAGEMAALNGEVSCEVVVARETAPRPAKMLRAIPVADPITKRFSVELEVPNGDGQLRAGLRVNVLFRCEGGQNVLLLPRRALTRRGDALVCFRIESAPACFVARQVEPHFAAIVGRPDMVRVLPGVAEESVLRANDEVAVAGHLMLEDGARVEVANRQEQPQATNGEKEPEGEAAT
ncbi:MAG: HlyD family efflux transporter periplasmic adaptor subunit [Planctomycetes bacterium]|nr:HlyD family efflux transporter periplasmic adaptor subunit [Planctomycetota bacterium]